MNLSQNIKAKTDMVNKDRQTKSRNDNNGWMPNLKHYDAVRFTLKFRLKYVATFQKFI